MTAENGASRSRATARGSVTLNGARPHSDRERGSVSLIALSLCVFIVIAALVTVDVSAVIIGRARAQTAADLAALAAVTPYPELPPRASANDAAGLASIPGGAASTATAGAATPGGAASIAGGALPTATGGAATLGGAAAPAAGAPATAPTATGSSGESGRASVGLLSPNGLGSPAERATTVAAANGGRVITCTCGPLETTIAVAVRVPLVPLGTSVQVTGYARAVLRQTVDQGRAAVA